MLIRHTLIYTLSRGLPGIANFLAIYAYTRLLSPEAYGSYSLIFAVVTIMNSLLFQWMRMGVLRFLPAMNEDTRPIFMSTIVKSFTILMLVTLVLSPLAFVWIPYSGKGIIILGIGLLLTWSYAWFDLNLTLLRSQLKPRVYGMVFTAKTMLTITLAISFILLGLDEVGLLLGMLLGYVVPTLIYTRKTWRGVRWRIRTKKQVQSLLQYGVPLTLTASLGFIIFYSGRFFLGLYHGLEETGVYAVAYDFTQQSLILIMQIVNLAGLPLIFEKWDKTVGAEEHNQIRQNIILLLFLSLPAAVGIAMLSGNLSGVLLGEHFRSAAAIVIPLVTIAAFLQGVKSFYLDIAFQIGKRTGLQLIPVVLSLACNFILNVVLIPTYGLFGAALSAIISYAVSLVTSWVLGRRIVALPIPIKEIGKIVLATVAMSGVLLLLWHLRGAGWLVVQCLAGALAYFIVAVAVNAGNFRPAVMNICARSLHKFRGNRSQQAIRKLESPE